MPHLDARHTVHALALSRLAARHLLLQLRHLQGKGNTRLAINHSMPGIDFPTHCHALACEPQSTQK